METTNVIHPQFDAVILADGQFPTSSQPLHILHSAPLIVCCDGATAKLLEHGLTPHAIVGDGDSLSPTLKERYASILHTSSCQETNDLTKAVSYLSHQNKTNIAILGATGAREDHSLGNISLLVHYMHHHIHARMYTDHGIFIPCHDTTTHACRTGQQVSIFAFGAKDLHAHGLRYPLYDFTTWWQGTLNECTTDEITIHAKGDYLLYLTY